MRSKLPSVLGAELVAAHMGADAVELDVRVSADGVLVVHHDAALADGIASPRATEQIDALHTLSTDPFRYLIAPRLAATRSTPISHGSSSTGENHEQAHHQGRHG